MISESEWQRHLSLQKAIVWEEAKGKLRALYQIQGNTYGGGSMDKIKFNKIKKDIEAFIKTFEEQGCHE